MAVYNSELRTAFNSSKPPGNKVRYLVLSQPQSLLLLSRCFIGRKGTFDAAAIGRHVLGVVFLSNLVQNREYFFIVVLFSVLYGRYFSNYQGRSEVRRSVRRAC